MYHQKPRDGAITRTQKQVVVKVFAISKLLYVSSIMSVPPSVFKEVEKICFNFIWNGHDKIKRNILYLNYDKGGFENVEFQVHDLCTACSVD